METGVAALVEGKDMRTRTLALLPLLMPAGCFFTNVEIPIGIPANEYEEKRVSSEPRAEGKVALIDVQGVLSSEQEDSILGARESAVAALVEKLKKAEEDDDVRAVIVRIDTPGGDVTTSDIMYHELLAFKGRTKRPVVAAFLGVAASGGYYVACACDRLVAHPTTVTGSIGVIALHFSLTGLMDKIGVKSQAIKSGPYKDIASPFRDLTEEDRKLLQGLIDQAYNRFVGVVAAGRKGRLTEAEIRALADGRIFAAAQALDAKLVDRVGYLEDAKEEAKKLAGIKAADLVMYSRKPRKLENPYSVNASAAGLPEGELAQARKLLGFRLYYIWEPYLLGR
jgi:protease-4